MEIRVGAGLLWRGGLPPLGCEAPLKPVAVILHESVVTGLRLLRNRTGASPLATGKPAPTLDLCRLMCLYDPPNQSEIGCEQESL